jgi:glutamate N-acetyltransferase/amino-acid N-acetyltransferase
VSSTNLTFENAAGHRAWLETQATLPAGFRVGTSTFEFIPAEVEMRARMTLTLIACDAPTPDFAAVFTRNAFPGAPIRVGRRRLQEPRLGAIVVNNKISNVCAPEGEAAAERMCEAAAAALGIQPQEVLPSSTGVIGWRLPMEPMLAAVPHAAGQLQSTSVLPAAEGIMTTDLYPKVRRAQIGGGSIVGIAKGAGMVEPDMATMLVYLLTDLRIPRERLRTLLSQSVAPSFNAISIDSDQSTSDTVALLATGRVPCTDEAVFVAALNRVCLDLAEDVVRNGEGVHHVIRCTVRGAPEAAIAKSTAKAVINSPLLKAAVCGNDPNVGRLVMAAGKHLGSAHPDLDLSRCTMTLGDTVVFRHGAFHLEPATEKALQGQLRQTELYSSQPPDETGFFRPPVDFPQHEGSVGISIDLGCGEASFTAIGCDLTHEYVSENADYRS